MSKERLGSPSLGIVSGAGPMAGLALMEKIIKLYQKKGAWRDADFPLIRLLNYPFSDMLSKGYDSSCIQKELLSCLDELSRTCDYVLISCQTLHAFLPEDYYNPQFIDFFDVLKSYLPPGTLTVAASMTSAKIQLHAKKLDRACIYLDPIKCQSMINRLLKGKKVDTQWLQKRAEKESVLLGCTEFSIPFRAINSRCIDPFVFIAECVFNTLGYERSC